MRGSRAQPGPGAIRAVLVLGSVLFAFLLAEALVRVLGLDPEAAPVRPTATGIPEMRPSSRGFHGTVDGQAFLEVRRNRLGLRDWEHPRWETTRILGVGDSFSHGFGVEQEETYLSVAERALWDRAPGTEIGIHKLGMNGTSQYAQLAVLPRYLSSIDPQIIVLAFSEDTDIDENLVQDPLLKDILAGRRQFVVSKEAARDRLHRWSALARFLRARRLRDTAARDVSAFARVVQAWGDRPHEFDDLLRSGWQRRFIDSFGSKLDDEWQVTENLLDRMRALAESRGARLVILRVVSRYAVDRAAWDRAVQSVCGHDPSAVASMCGTLDPEHTARRLQSYAERHGLLYVDPSSALKAAFAAGEAVYFPPPEIHWTRAGHEAVGLELSRALGEKLALPEPPARRARKPRHLAAMWTPEPASGWGTWIPELAGNSRASLAQALLWVDEARVDWIALPTLLDGGEWKIEPGASAVIARLVEQRRFGMVLATVAFAVRFPPGAPHVLGRRALDDLLGQHVFPLGSDYATACGHPLLFVDRGTEVSDDRFTVIRASAAETAGDPSACKTEGTGPSGDAACSEVGSIQELCVAAVNEGKGFPGDPDVVLVSRYESEGPGNVQPKEPARRLTTELVADAVARWKRGEPGEHAPGARALELYRSWLPAGPAAAQSVTVPVTSPRFTCSGCFDVEQTPEGPFAWTGETAEMTLQGFTPNSRWSLTLGVVASGVARQITFEADGVRSDVPLQLGPVAWPNPVLVRSDGTLRFTLHVEAFRPKGPAGDGAGQRLLGVGVKEVSVVELR